MIIGTIFGTVLNASIFELVLFETLENPEHKARKDKIEKIIGKYNFRNDPRKSMELLADSLYSLDLSEEYDFISFLPTYYRNIVLNKIKDNFQHKLKVLKICSFNMFIEVYTKVKKRKCIE